MLNSLVRLSAPASAVSILLSLLALPLPAIGQERAPTCTVPADILRLGAPLDNVARRIAEGKPIKVVAIGSSSTAGAGASSPQTSYPSRLEVELQARLPHVAVTVLNRGVNGEEAKDMLARFDSAVIAEKPDLVLWQVGTNSVLRDRVLAREAPLILEGLAKLKASGADVVLIDPQFAPKVIAKPDCDAMVSLIGAAARERKVGLFHRFAVMRHWHETTRIPFAAFLSDDGLHMNDWSYACVAKLLAGAIVQAAGHGATVAGVPTPAN